MIRRAIRLASRRGAAMLAMVMLGSCGGGGEGEPPRRAGQAAAPSAERTRPQDALNPQLVIPPDAHLKGVFSPLYDWPLIAIHAALLPDGRVVTYGTDTLGRQTGYFVYDVWDSTQLPDAGHQTLPNLTATDLFCSSQLLIMQGGSPRLLINNGDNWTGSGTTNTGNTRSSVFNPADNTLVAGQGTRRPRWYGSSTMLLNGEVYIQGGQLETGSDKPEIRGTDGSYRELDLDTSRYYYYYPRNFVAPDGRIFGIDAGGKMYYVEPEVPRLTEVGQVQNLILGTDSSIAMFRPGRFLQFGGFTDKSIVIDITGPGGLPTQTGQRTMTAHRSMPTAVLLPDGQVLAVGGSPIWNNLDNAPLHVETWNPQSGNWTAGASGAVPRLYHSTALLLPDASVLVAGGGAPGPLTNLNAEVYYPPYLFTADGQWAPRPAITGTPDYLQVGKTIAIDVAGGRPISRVTLLKSGSVTHNWNMDQRFLELPFRAEGGRLFAQTPTHAAEVPPGYYLLFVVDDAGVPSKAQILNLGIAAEPDPEVVPVLASPGNQSTPAGTLVDLGLVASDPNGDTLSFSASGLPPGLTISATTGHIGGAPTANGSYDVVLSASDGFNATSVAIVWQVTGSLPLQLDALAPPVPMVVDGVLQVQAAATGQGVEYQWNFGDGSPPTAWSADGHASHTYTRAGLFTLTVTVRDAYGQQQSASVLQMVHLPLGGGGRPMSSSGLLATPAGDGLPARWWVANPDSDSVSVFDATTLARLAEIPVGATPRSLARAGDGRVWVASQRGASLSVIDPQALAVAATLVLPRGSQPQGLVMSPAGAQAFVTLQASGQLLRLDTASFAQTGQLSIGPQPGGLAMSGDGTRLWVSRFVTGPLPGEATATVSPTPATGGEVWVVDPATMKRIKTVVLQHSDRPDFETQGRGIPNYLGAPALSPDGSQAFVPSKQDNLQRGLQRDGQPLNFQNTVRAVSSRLLLPAGPEDAAGRIDHDNAGLASAALFDERGVLLFVALETSREVAVLDAHSRQQLMRVAVGRTPRSLALSADGLTLVVDNHLDRTLGLFDLRPLLQQGQLSLPALATLPTVGSEPLAPAVLLGKQLFHDARDPRLARDAYLSCAACHRDGGGDGRVWDLSDAGEGLRNTVHLRGRAGMGQGPLHWSGNFDEVQDFETQIRRLAGGTGLMADADYSAGTRSQPLGDAKAGLSPELDALAAYVASLDRVDPSPYRAASGALTTKAQAGQLVFQAQRCASCHGGAGFTGSGALGLVDIGTIKPTSGQRLGGPLTGLDVPTLRDAWRTGPYLHDGSAPTLEAAVAAHQGVSLGSDDMAALVAYLREIGSDEPAAPEEGSGLAGQYFNTKNLSGVPVLSRTEGVDADWGTGSPGPGVNPDRFSVRWTGFVQAPATGSYLFQTRSDEGVRLWVNGAKLVSHWAAHTAADDTAGKALKLVAGRRYPLVLEFFDGSGPAEIRLRWKPPGAGDFTPVPAERLYPG